jgi:hypothetical protein
MPQFYKASRLALEWFEYKENSVENNGQINYDLIPFGGFKMFMLILMFASPFIVFYLMGYRSINVAIFGTIFVVTCITLRYVFEATYRKITSSRAFFFGMRCAIKDDWNKFREFAGQYFNNHVVGHKMFHGKWTNGNIVLGTFEKVNADYLLEIPKGGWFRRPKLWVHGKQSKIWRIEVSEAINFLGSKQMVLSLVDKRNEKISLSAEWILEILRLNTELWWCQYYDNPKTCIQVMEYMESKVASLSQQNQALAEIAFGTLDELAESKNFGRHPGGRFVREFLGKSLTKIFPDDPRLDKYKEYSPDWDVQDPSVGTPTKKWKVRSLKN